ncbi:MAG: substrate-binding domain-containing protein [bacterium]
MVADRLNRRGGGGRCVWVAASSTAALRALARRETHVAGVHLVDARTGEHNVADVRRLAGSAPVVLVTLARWEAGLVVAAGNPRAIGPESLARPGLRQVAREVGSGARRLLDATLAAVGAALPADALRAAGHLEVAHAIALGAADVGVASRDAAVAHGLGFVPLAEERYDLVIPRAALADARIERLVDLLTTAPLRRELAALGYDVRPAGDRVAAIEAA